MKKEKEILLYQVAQIVVLEGVLFNLRHTEWENSDTVRFEYGIGGTLKLWLYRNGTYKAEPEIKNKKVIKFLKSLTFKPWK